MANQTDPTGEGEIWSSRPSAWAILLRPLGLIAIVLIIAVFLWPAVAGLLPGGGAADLVGLALAFVGIALCWSAAAWSVETFTLTPHRLVWQSGVLRRLRVDVPLNRIQNSVIHRRVRERLLGLGTIGFATAGTDSYEMVWRMVRSPERVLARVDEAVRASRKLVREEETRQMQAHVGVHIPVIGLAGGIGSGKSEVARILRDLGCVVLDSDHQAKALLDEPDVRHELVSWWGDRVLLPPEAGAPGGERRIDRKAVASIVFGDPDARSRLERLIHPMLKRERRMKIQELRRSTPRPAAIVIDAPLLFEAGVDSECDAVLFVDAPREQRLARVRASRGWDEAELARREAAQLPVEEKRRRSTVVVNNTGNLADLEARVREGAENLGLSV